MSKEGWNRIQRPALITTRTQLLCSCRAVCLSLPASLEMPACSALRLHSLWQVHLEETADRCKAKLPYAICPVVIASFLSSSGVEHRPIIILFVGKYQSWMWAKLSMWVFPLLVLLTAKGRGLGTWQKRQIRLPPEYMLWTTVLHH